MRYIFSIRKLTISAVLASCIVPSSYAGETDSLPLVIAMSIFTGGYSIVHDGKAGFMDYAEANFISLATSEFLNHTIQASKPNGGENAFPSTHTAVAAANASLMGIRYGWKWGLGMSILTAGVAAERFHHEEADVWDISAGALLGALSGYIATRTFNFNNQKLQFIPTFLPEEKGLLMNVRYQL